MYQVSNAFKLAANQAVQEHRISGTIGSVSFSETNIVDGSFVITNQSTDTSDVVLGSCYVGQLTAEFIGLNIAWGKWINKTITPIFELKTDANTWESVPLGIFKIKEANHTERGVQITAYDNMIKFDKKFKKSHFMNMSGMWNIIQQLCTDSGVTLGMTRAEIEALPNGDRTGINIYGSKGKKAEFANDITTNRDLLFWVAQTLGCFATINRLGQLEFRKYTQTVVDKVSDHNRIEGATFADYVTHYVGIYIENLDDNTEDYYGYDVTALTEERNETLSEITADNELIAGYIEDLAEWDEKLANHECTQQEYDAAVAEITAAMHPLELEVKQLAKRLDWLNNAIEQAADDGSDMVLGANPLVMAESLVTRDSQRREILGALDGITYTPFQAIVVCGCIYDLGDVIQFSGGLYNSDTDSFGCVMQYTYTHNGGTELEGFGVDPSLVVVRNKTQKSTDRATRNATTALNENDLVFDIDTDSNNKVVATNKNAYDQTSMTRKWKMWEYNFNFPSGQNWSKWDVEITMPYPFSISIWPDLDHGNPRYCSFNGKTYQSMCVGLAIRPNSNIGSWTYITSQTWTCYAGNQSTSYNGFNTYVHRRNNLNFYNTSTSVGTIMYGPVDLNDVDYVFNNINEWYAAMDNGTMEIPTVSPDDECVLASEATARQAAANVEYIAEKMAGNNPQRETETYSGSVNVMSERTMQRLSNAFYSMGENIGSFANSVDDVKVDGTSVVTSRIANINTMTGATDQANGTKGLVPAPAIADKEKFLRGDGTWQDSSAVEANPSGTATADLTKLGIDGTVYGIKDADAVHSADVGVAGGVAELDSNGRVPSSQLPSYVDDVVEYASISAFPVTGESGKIYVALDTNLTYRWGGTEYVEISPSLALGETSTTAYRGDRGKAAYDHSQLFPVIDGKVCIVYET